MIRSRKAVARSAAFRFVYLLLKNGSSSQFSSASSPELSTQDRDIAYNAVNYVVSHSRVFWYRARKMVREAFETTYSLTYKQHLALDKWPLTDPNYSGWEDDEETTDDEYGCDSDFDLDSDSS